MARAGRIVVAVAGVLVAALALLVGGAMLFLRSARGGAVVGRWLAARVNASIAGHLEVRRLSFGGRWLHVEGVELDDPEGATVARVGVVDVRFSLLALLRREVEISELVVERPSLTLRESRRGWNAARALEPREAKAESEPTRLHVAVERLHVTGGSVDVRPSGANSRRIRAGAISLDGAGWFAAPAADLEGHLRLAARLEAPFAAPVEVGIDLGRSGGAARGTARVAVGESSLAARASLERDARYRIDVDRARITPELVRAFAPLRARVPLEIAAALEGTGPRGRGRVDLAAAKGRVHVEAGWDADAHRVEALSVTAQHVDLGGVVEGLPRSDVSLQLGGHVAGTTLDTLAGALRLQMATGQLGGHALGPARLDASAARGEIRVAALEAALPGARVRARGTISRARVDVGVDIQEMDLAATARSLRPLVPIALAGDGHLHVRVTGPTAHPAVALDGAFQRLDVAGNSARGLSLDGVWPDVRRPLLANAELRAHGVTLGDHEMSEVSAHLESRGRDFSFALRTAGQGALGAAATGRWSGDRHALSLASLELTMPEVTWRQAAAPVEIVFEPIAVHGLDLRANGQRLAADLAIEEGRLHGSVDASALELSRLPRWLLARELPPTRLDLHAKLDVPARWPPPPRAPASANVELRIGEVKGLLALAGVARPRVAGALHLTLALAGTAEAPRIDGRAELARASVDGQSLGDVRFTARGGDEGPTSVSVALAPAGEGLGAGTIELSTPASLARLVKLPRQARAWMATPLQATGDLRRVPLSALSRLAGVGPLGGTMSARLDVRGTAAAPHGAINVEVQRATGPRFPATDVRADLAAGDRDVRFSARVWRADARVSGGAGSGAAHLLGWASGVVKVPASKLDDLAAVERAPLDIGLGAGPFEIEHTASPGADALRASVTLHGEIRGTAEAPVASLKVEANRATLGGAAAGLARAALDYADGHAHGSAMLAPAGGGTLRVTARADADLGLGAVLRGLDPARWPVEGQLEAERFDPEWLPALVPGVRRAAGAISAHVRAHGTASAPDVSGQIEWTRGALTLSGLGAYEDVHLRAHAAGGTLTLDELTTASAGGRAQATGSLAFAGAGGPLHLVTKLKRFPIYAQGRRMARISADVKADGTFGASDTSGTSSDGRNLDAHVRIPDAHVELEQIEKRDVQPLDRPDDILLFDDGRPVDVHAAPGPSAGTERPFSVRLVVDAPRNLWVRSDDANVELGFSKDFRVELGAEPQIFGQVTVRRGRVDVIGRRFDLQADSRLEFTGPPDEPVLDVTAKHVNESANVTVIVTVKGPIDELAINVSAPDRPDLTETQLYTLIIAGRLDLGATGTTSSTSPTSEAASLVGGALAGALQKVVARRLPLDVFSFETGDGFTGTRVEAGKNLGSKLYVGYVGRTGANPALLQNRNAVHLEYQFSSRWSLDVEYGDVGTGTADLLWTKRY
jgi:translocation and assembly module TamB